MRHRLTAGVLVFGALAAPPARAQTVAELQRQIDALKAQVEQLLAAQRSAAVTPPVPAPVTRPAAPPAAPPAAMAATAPVVPAAPTPAPVRPAASLAAAPAKPKPWYERVTLRGYTQLRVSEIVSGDRNGADGFSSLRSVQDGGISDRNNFSIRRLRLILQGDISDRVSIYLQPDFATVVNNQSAGERREGFGQLRDAYVDWFLDDDHAFRLRFGQSKVPFGWENLQSSSNRLALDRTDAINSAVPSERDLGVVAYFTPPQVKRIWDRLAKDGQKLFGNYGAFGVAAYNGQGTNRVERNNGLMTVAMATWPFELDALGDAFRGQVLEIGGSALRNRVRPEVRNGGVSARDFADNRLGVHAMLYPQPFGFQAEWNWGRGPEYDTGAEVIETKRLHGGYVQGMARVAHSPLGAFMPFVRWQRYRGGWKAGLDAPRLETDELEFGVEFQPTPPLELTVSYGETERREADTRLTGRAKGSLLRTQLQWNY